MGMMKFSKFKKSIATIVLAAILIHPIAKPRTAEAIVGIVAGGGATIGLVSMAGLGITGAVVGGAFPYIARCGKGGDSGWDVVAAVLLGAAGAWIGVAAGILVLDAPGTSFAEFTELSPDDAAKLGVAEIDREAFNAEVEELNAIQAEVVSRLTKSREHTVDAAEQAWKEFQPLVSAEAFRVAQRVTHHMMQQLSEAAATQSALQD